MSPGFLVLFNFFVGICALLRLEELLNHHKIVEEYNKYISNGRNSPERTCVILNMMKFNTCPDMLVEFAKANYCPKLILSKEALGSPMDFGSNLIIFMVAEAEHLLEALTQFSTTAHCDNGGRFKFVICKPIKNRIKLHTLSEEMWKIKILNFVILYYNTTLKGAIFDPFRDKLDTHPAKILGSEINEFPDKLKDTNGYPIKLILCPNVTAVHSRHNFDFNFMSVFQQGTNATIIANNQRANLMYGPILFNLLASTDDEFCPITQPYYLAKIAGIKDEVTCTRPHMINNIVALVPKPQILPANFYAALKLTDILVFYIILTLVTLLDKYLSLHPKCNKLDVFGFLAATLRASVPRFNTTKTAVRYFWILTCVFIWAIIDVQFLHVLLLPRYSKKITTIQDIKESGFTLYSYGYHKHVGLNGTDVGLETLRDMAMNNRIKAIFVGSYKSLSLYLKVTLNKQKTLILEMMQEPLKPMFGCFAIKKNSPYFGKVEELSYRVLEMGVKTIVPERYKRRIDEHVKLNYETLESTFRLLYYSMLFASLVFMIELGMFYLTRRNRS